VLGRKSRRAELETLQFAHRWHTRASPPNHCQLTRVHKLESVETMRRFFGRYRAVLSIRAVIYHHLALRTRRTEQKDLNGSHQVSLWVTILLAAPPASSHCGMESGVLPKNCL
jgi:hypothetical protein